MASDVSLLMSRQREFTRLLQEFAGVKADGVYGPYTAAALVRKLGLAPVDFGVAPTPGPAIKVAIDPGHGMGNRTRGVFDPGAQEGDLREADVALSWGLELRAALEAVKVPTWMTREDNSSECPLETRASRAMLAGCTHFVAVHVNDADDPAANGLEVCYNDDADLARVALAAVGASMKDMRSRGAKQRTDLRVLKFDGRAVLVEVGFIGSAKDRAVFLDAGVRRSACGALAWALKRDGLGNVIG